MQESRFTAEKLDDFVPADHTPRKIQIPVNEEKMHQYSLFCATYADSGRKKLMRAPLLQVSLSIRSERQQRMRFRQASEGEQGESILDPFVGKPEALRRDVPSQRPFRTDRRPAAARPLLVERRDRRHCCRPRNHRRYLTKALFFLRQLALPNTFCLLSASLRAESYKASSYRESFWTDRCVMSSKLRCGV